MNLSTLLVFVIPTLVASAESNADTRNTKQQQLRKRTDAWTTYFEDEVYEKPVTEERELHGDRYHIFRGYHSSSKSGKSGSSRSSYSCSSSSSSGKSGKSCSSSSTRSTSSKSGKSGSSSRRLDKRLVNLRASLRSEDLSADEELERELHGYRWIWPDHSERYKMLKKKHHRGYHSSSSSKSGKSGSRSYSCSSSSSGKSGKSCSSSSRSSSTYSSSKSGKSGSSSRSYSTSKSGKSGSSSHRLRS